MFALQREKEKNKRNQTIDYRSCFGCRLNIVRYNMFIHVHGQIASFDIVA